MSAHIQLRHGAPTDSGELVYDPQFTCMTPLPNRRDSLVGAAADLQLFSVRRTTGGAARRPHRNGRPRRRRGETREQCVGRDIRGSIGYSQATQPLQAKLFVRSTLNHNHSCIPAICAARVRGRTCSSPPGGLSPSSWDLGKEEPAWSSGSTWCRIRIQGLLSGARTAGRLTCWSPT